MVVANGSLKANGHANGNGKLNGKMNGKPTRGRAAVKRKSSLFGWLISTIARLSTWAAILTILFRCPSSLEECNESSSFICKRYFQAKEIVSPHIKPYYDRYAEPYVEVIRPYRDTVNEKVIQPARTYAVQYGAPWAEAGKEYAWIQWEKNAQPQLVHIQTLAQGHYDKTLAPYLSQAGDAVGPYYDVAKLNAIQGYNEYILPGYDFVQPYAAQSYDITSDFTTTKALPAAYWALNKTYVFVDTALWPQVRVLYLENVEPQLLRIGERLGRYKTKVRKGTQDVLPDSDDVADVFQSVETKISASSSSVVSSSQAPAHTESPIPEEVKYDNPVQAPPAAENESEKRRKAREMVAEDLEMWQNKFATQADEGATDIEDRIDEIANRMVHEQVDVSGRKLVDTLESTVTSEVAKLKLKISSIVETSPGTAEEAESVVVQAIRSTGMTVKQKAQGIRQWRQQYDADLQKTVLQAADVHFKILDETRNLALQQLGMKWAWADGVTYKDWAKYHELKSTLTQWTEQLKNLVVTHPALIQAQEAAAHVEDEGMGIASEAAQVLGSLKEVAKYKILASDSTDSFELKPIKLAAEAAQKVKAAKDAAAKTAREAQEAAVRKAKDAEEAAAKKAQEASSIVVDNAGEATVTLASVSSRASTAVDEMSTAASQSVASVLSEGEAATAAAGEELASGASAVSSSVRSAATGASSGAEDLSDKVKDMYATGSDTVVSVASEASQAATKATSAASGAVKSAATEASDKVAPSGHHYEGSLAEDVDTVVDGDSVEIEEDINAAREETLPIETPAVKPAFLGVAAQSVANRQPILDDYVDTDAIASATAAAESAYSNAASLAAEQYASAVSVVSAQIYGTPKPVHEQLFASVSAAYDNALAAASGKLTDAAAAASKGYSDYAKPTPTASTPSLDWAKVEAIAAQRLNEGRLWADLQYQSAMIAMGYATATPTAMTDKYYQEAKRNYFAGLGMAQDRYASFISAASSALSSVTATPTPTNIVGSVSSIASVAQQSAASVVDAAQQSAAYVVDVAQQSAASVANAAEGAASAAYSAATDSVASVADAIEGGISSAYDSAAEQVYLAGVSASETWDTVLGEINERIYGQQNPMIGWYDSMFEEASSAASAASGAAAGGASSLSQAAADSAVTASAAAQDQYDAVNKLISELIHGKEPTFSESVLARFNEAYKTVGAVYATAAASVESVVGDASSAVASVGDKVGSAASEATEAVKESAQRYKDEL